MIMCILKLNGKHINWNSQIKFYETIIFLLLFGMQATNLGEKIGLKHFKPVKPLGCGDTGRY